MYAKKSALNQKVPNVVSFVKMSQFCSISTLAAVYVSGVYRRLGNFRHEKFLLITFNDEN